MTTPIRGTTFAALALAALLLAACGGGNSSAVSPSTQKQSEGSAITPDRPFTLRVGEHAALADGTLRVGFDSVTNDSRCPSNVQCVRAGEAIVMLTVRAGAIDSTVRLQTPSASAPTAIAPSTAIIGAYAVTFSSLEPVPVAGQERRQADYVAQLVVSRK
jgi:hypothetical protein